MAGCTAASLPGLTSAMLTARELADEFPDSGNGCIWVDTLFGGDFEYGEFSFTQPLLMLPVEGGQIVEGDSFLSMAIPNMDPLERCLWTSCQMNNRFNGKLLCECIEPGLIQGPLECINIAAVAEHFCEDEAIRQHRSLCQENGCLCCSNGLLKCLQTSQNCTVLECVGPAALILVE